MGITLDLPEHDDNDESTRAGVEGKEPAPQSADSHAAPADHNPEADQQPEEVLPAWAKQIEHKLDQLLNPVTEQPAPAVEQEPEQLEQPEEPDPQPEQAEEPAPSSRSNGRVREIRLFGG